MSSLRMCGALALTVAATAAVAALAVAGGQPLAVTSSLDGMKVLPQQSHWLAHPNVAADEVVDVTFLIDGKLRWTEHRAPYVFGGDNQAGHLGYLFTSWLAPGLHRFTTRVDTRDGRTAVDNVSARVLPAPAPPDALSGTWTRIVTADDATKADPKYGANNKPPAGRWRLVIDRVGVWELDPEGGGIAESYSVSGHVLHAGAPIQMIPAQVNGPGHIRRFGRRIDAGGGVTCDEAGPFGTYRWARAADELTLTPIHEPCGQRRAIYEGTWTRVN